MSNILIVDDDPLATRLVTALLAPLGLPLRAASCRREALEEIATECPRLVVLDLCLPDASGLDVLAEMHVAHPELIVIMLTAENDVPTAVRALRQGAFDYLVKPVDHDKLLHSVSRALERLRLLEEVRSLRSRSRSGLLTETMGPSAEIAALANRVEQVASSRMSVLVLGETGSGKELVARAVHDSSTRRNEPFVAVDCGAIPDTLLESELFGHEEGAFTGARRRQRGRFAQAEGGTLFLDEVGNLSAANQAKLLRVLEERKVRPLGATQDIELDVRVVAATNEDLERRAKAGDFRLDVYYRLAEYTVQIPPLRVRRSDVFYLADRFRHEAAAELGRSVLAFDEDALERLRNHAWRGNVRELRNVVRQAVLGCRDQTITYQTLASFLPPPSAASVMPPAMRARANGPVRSLKMVSDAAAEAAERGVLTETLAATSGNRAEAARLLNVDAKTLYRKLKRYGMSV